jgi:protein phosphatase methylesterase 1
MLPPRRPHALAEERAAGGGAPPSTSSPPCLPSCSDTTTTAAPFARPRSRFSDVGPAGPLEQAGSGAPGAEPIRGSTTTTTAQGSLGKGTAGAATAAAATEALNHPPPKNPRVRVRPWSDYFTERLVVPVPERGITFNVYAAGPPDAAVTFLCLHGGGYTGATWALVARALARPPPPPACASGGGGAAAAATPTPPPPLYRVLAPDLRGHGLTVAEDEADLSAETLRDDVLALWRALLPLSSSSSSSCSSSAVVVVGHSMSGAIAVKACAAAATTSSSSSPAFPGLAGCVVVDVVEGTALAALPHMRAVLAARPQGFASPEEAARWALRSGATRCREAAEVSAPTQVVKAAVVAGEGAGAAAAPTGRRRTQQQQQGEEEEAMEDDGDHQNQHPHPHHRYVWRTDLARSSHHWPGWYTGLSAAFLEGLPAGLPRALIAAGADRLDRALTVAQMQGRFQLVLVAHSGHAVQEDASGVVAAALSSMARRFRMGEPALVLPGMGAAGGAAAAAAGAGGRGGVVLPVAAGPFFASSAAAGRRGPGGTTALAAGVERGGRGGGGGFEGAIEEEEEGEGGSVG